MNPIQAAPHLADRKRKFWGNMIWISAIFLVVSICSGVAAPVIGMVNAFGKLKAAGAADPNELAGDISVAILGGLYSIPFALAALVIFIIAIVRHRKFSNPSQAG
jgi:hypothetical protein